MVSLKVFLVVGLVLFLLNTQVNGLKCVMCHSRNHRGCLYLDDLVGVKEKKCKKSEVCVKLTIYMVNKAGFFKQGYGAERDCVEWTEDQGPLEGCHELPNSREPNFPGLRCYCNDTDFCNGATESLSSKYVYLTAIVPLLIKCIFYDYFLYTFYA